MHICIWFIKPSITGVYIEYTLVDMQISGNMHYTNIAVINILTN